MPRLELPIQFTLADLNTMHMRSLLDILRDAPDGPLTAKQPLAQSMAVPHKMSNAEWDAYEAREAAKSPPKTLWERITEEPEDAP